MPRIIVILGTLVRSDHRARLQRIDLVERGEPLLPLLRVRLDEVQVNVVVDGVARNDESDRRNMQSGREVRVGMAELDDDHVVPLQVDDVSV